MISCELFLRLVDARDVLERHLLLRARRAAWPCSCRTSSALFPPLCIWRMQEHPEADHQQDRRPGVEDQGPGAVAGLLGLDLHTLVDELVGEAVVLRRRVGPERLVGRLVDPRHLVPGNRHRGDLAGVDLLHELAEADLAVALLEIGREIPDQHADDDQHHPEQQTLQRGVHPRSPLSLKITTARVPSLTRNSSEITCPATHTMRSSRSTTSGIRSRSPRGTRRSTK